MSFIDRLSGQSVEQPPERTHFGRWLFHVDDTDPDDATGHTNGCSAGEGDVLAPGTTGDWALVRPGDTIPIRGRFFPDTLPDDQDAEALLQLGQMLRDPDKAGGGWSEWSDISPLAPGLDEAVKPHPFEDRIVAEIDHLAAVCRRPRTHIRRESERILVARARRVARDAPAQLASHTEDWEYRTVAGIRPRRILADVREERWDLYENRVAVRLVDELVAWLRRRIVEVRRIRGDVYARMEQIRGAASGTRHRAHRIYKLWGEGWDNRPSEVADSTLKRLEVLVYKLLSLMDSPLYKHIPVRASAPSGSRTTNLFSNDDHYRGVARLWHEWSRLAAPRAASRSELWNRYQDLHRGFDAWCMLVILRSCLQLRLQPTEDDDWESNICPGSAVRLDQGFEVEWNRAGTITLADTHEDRALLRFVPLIHGLEGARTPEAAETRVAPFVEAVADAAHWTVILHPAVSGSPPHDALAGVGNPPVPGTRGAIDFIRVSPFSLESVERVARAIRWTTLVHRMLAYPPEVRAIPTSTLQAYPELRTVLESNTGRWCKSERHGSAKWVVVGQPPDRLRQAVAESLKDGRARLQRLSDESRDVQDGLKRNRGKGRSMAELNRKKRRMLQPLREAEDRVRSLESFETQIRMACEDIAALATCPACGKHDTEFEAREHDCFAGRCASKECGAQWELHHDPDVAGRRDSGSHGALKSRIPVFRPGDANADAWRRRDAAPQWVDDFLGCDVLAIPATAEGGDSVFLPPRTVPRSP